MRKCHFNTVKRKNVGYDIMLSHRCMFMNFELTLLHETNAERGIVWPNRLAPSLGVCLVKKSKLGIHERKKGFHRPILYENGIGRDQFKVEDLVQDAKFRNGLWSSPHCQH